jgi:acetyltransferase-like isoleucine patch superfamily enzyme
MEVGKYTYGQNNIKILAGEGGKVQIGKFCSIGADITFFVGGNHATDWVTTYPFGLINQNIFTHPINQDANRVNCKRNNDIIIGNDVWIGSGTTIMRGVTVGDGAVIARNSHVVTNVKAYSVVGGNPSRFYYTRFDEETIKKLLELKWWDFEDNIINEILPLLCSNKFDLLFEVCNKLKNK